MFETALGRMRAFLVGVAGLPTTYRPDVVGAAERAKVHVAVYAPIDIDNFPLDALIKHNVLSDHYTHNLHHACFDTAAYSLLENLAAGPDAAYMLLDDTVQLKHYVIEALATHARSLPAWDVLFLDCPSTCNTVGRLGFTDANKVCLVVVDVNDDDDDDDDNAAVIAITLLVLTSFILIISARIRAATLPLSRPPLPRP